MRQTERVLLRIPIEVSGQGTDRNAFTEKTFTLVVNRHGAQIALRNSIRPNDRLTIINLQSKIRCPFRAVARVEKPMGECPEWGVECLEPEVNFWGIAFPEKSGAPAKQELIDALLECSRCRFRELAQLTMEQYRVLISQSSLARECAKCKSVTEWKFGFVEPETEDAVLSAGGQKMATSSAAGARQRRAKRLTVKLPVRIRLQDGREEIMRVENLSKLGVCFVSTLGMKEGERVRITIGHAPGGNQKEVEARVVWRKPVEGTNRAIYGLELEVSD